ncbi:MAG: hypothetical protein CMM08_16000 [Rhodospirillaceae bacterium]|jgi:ketosteroid isomerase-like protein|nr:hypothetical protein [Rhodospirillaceae bacterium]|tara:strand:+ start:1072 stop:1458 length:387 start_codon:yes stop_codon:yes gene_type:complete
MPESELEDLMKRFGRAFFKADREGLSKCLSDDFVWHLHHGDRGTDEPHGRTLLGLDAFLEELAWRKQNWREVRIENVRECPAGDGVLQTFEISGINEAGQAFRNKVVDLYTIVNGRIAVKDTYWKVFR